jgi:hypothetical protein
MANGSILSAMASFPKPCIFREAWNVAESFQALQEKFN